MRVDDLSFAYEKSLMGNVICPRCNAVQIGTERPEPGTYCCDECSQQFIVSKEFAEKQPITVNEVRRQVENLSERVRRLEKELGIKTK